MSGNQKKAAIVASAGVALGVGLYYFLSVRQARKVKASVPTEPTAPTEATEATVPTASDILPSPLSAAEKEPDVSGPSCDPPVEQADLQSIEEVPVLAASIISFGHESPTSSFITVEREDCDVVQAASRQPDARGEAAAAGQLVTEENYFESYSQADTAIRLAEAVSVTNVSDLVGGRASPPPQLPPDASASVLNPSVPDNIPDVLTDSVTFDAPSLSEISTLGEPDLTWVPDHDSDDVFAREMTSMREDDDSIWSHSVTEAEKPLPCPEASFSLIGKVIEEDEEAEEGLAQELKGDESDQRAPEEVPKSLGSEDLTQF